MLFKEAVTISESDDKIFDLRREELVSDLAHRLMQKLLFGGFVKQEYINDRGKRTIIISLNVESIAE